MNKIIRDFIKSFLGNSFRCPFHIEGEINKTHLEITLSENSTERIHAMKHACIDFYQNPQKYTALLITLPASLHQKSRSLQELKTNLFSYQCEFAAAHVSAMVYPHSIYRDNNNQEWLPFAIGRELIRVCRMFGHKRPKNDFDLAAFLQKFIGSTITLRENEVVTMNMVPLLLNEDIVFKIGTVGGKFSYTIKRAYDAKDILLSKNCITFITCPFYPTTFGRFSKHIKIVVTRGADISKVDPHFADLIRQKNKRIFKAHNVVVPNIKDWSLAEGLWIPEYEEKTEKIS